LRRKPFILILILGLWAVAVIGAAHSSLPQTNGVPISGEQHHHLVVENKFIRAYEVELAPHDSTLLHRHEKDYVYVVFGDADVTNAVQGQPEVKVHLPDTTVNFARGPFAHVAGNDGNTTFRNITIELLSNQGELKTYYPSVKAALDAAMTQSEKDPIARFRGGFDSAILETDAIRVSAVRVKPNETWSPLNLNHAYLVVWIERWKEKLSPSDPNAPIFPIHMESWFEPGQIVYVQNPKLVPMDAVLIEFKDSQISTLSSLEIKPR
jgi:hypothetical protein